MHDSVAVTPLHRWTLHASDSQFNALAGAIGGFTSGIVTCPLDVIKTKLQAQGGQILVEKGRHVGHPKIYNGLVGTASVIWREEGIRGLYRGLGPIVMGYLPTWAVWFTVYNKSKGWLGGYYGKLKAGNVGELPFANRRDARRQQPCHQLLVLHNRRRQQHDRHKPDLGHQDPAHVTEQHPFSIPKRVILPQAR